MLPNCAAETEALSVCRVPCLSQILSTVYVDSESDAVCVYRQFVAV